MTDDMAIGLVGTSRTFRETTSRLPTIARISGAVLIRGETGTGKNLVARTLHDLGPRHDQPFVVLNCGTSLDQSLEVDLFGDGAASGNGSPGTGLLQQASGGTLYLD